MDRQTAKRKTFLPMAVGNLREFRRGTPGYHDNLNLGRAAMSRMVTHIVLDGEKSWSPSNVQLFLDDGQLAFSEHSARHVLRTFAAALRPEFSQEILKLRCRKPRNLIV